MLNLGTVLLRCKSQLVLLALVLKLIEKLFEGNDSVYTKVLKELNNCGNAEKAKNILSDQAIEYNWNLEDKLTLKFVQLIERRYPST